MENKNTLAKIAIAINVVLLILIIFLFTKIGKPDTTEAALNSPNESDSTELSEEVTATTGKVAYFNMDSLSVNLLIYAEIEKEMQIAGAEAKKKIASEERKMENWNKKWQDKGTLMSAEIEKRQREGLALQEKAMMIERQVQMELQQKQEGYMSTLMLRISKATEKMAKANGYDVINAYQLGQSPWYYHKSMDITPELIEAMNADFKESSGMNDSE